MNKLSVFGIGFIGSKFIELYNKKCLPIKSGDWEPKSKDILYFRSTTNNYHIFSDVYLDIHVNLENLLKVLERCKNKDITFNFVSSWFVYSGCKELPAKENDTGEVLGFYGATKKCAESLLITFCEVNNIKWRIFRLCNIIGKEDKYSKEKNAIQYLINEIKNGRDIELYWGGDFYREYLDVESCCEAINHLITKSPVNNIYNVGSGQKHKFLDLMNFVKKETGSKSKFKSISPKPFHRLVQIKNMYLDISKLRNTGYDKEIDIYEEIKKLL